jgi:hypothetical protein
MKEECEISRLAVFAMASKPRFSVPQPSEYFTRPASNRSRHSKSSNCVSHEFTRRGLPHYAVDRRGSPQRSGVGSSRAGWFPEAAHALNRACCEQPILVFTKRNRPMCHTPGAATIVEVDATESTHGEVLPFPESLLSGWDARSAYGGSTQSSCLISETRTARAQKAFPSRQVVSLSGDGGFTIEDRYWRGAYPNWVY